MKKTASLSSRRPVIQKEESVHFLETMSTGSLIGQNSHCMPVLLIRSSKSLKYKTSLLMLFC